MSRRRRGVLLLALALVLGGLAAADVSRREREVEARLRPLVPVVVARSEVAPGTALEPGRLGVREVPARFAPPGALASAREAVGLRAAIAIPAGGVLTSSQLSDPGGAAGGPGLRGGERVADVIAVAPPDAISAGSRVDVLVTREGRDGAGGRTSLALEDVEVLSAAPAPADDGAARPAGDSPGGPKVAASLRVTLRQAVYLTAAQSFAREIRLLPRAPGDRERGTQGLSVDSGLG
jgi:pilus assembly protein CpaB